MAAPPVLGVDVGGTKVAVGALVGDALQGPLKVPTEVSSADALLDGIAAAVEQAKAEYGDPAAIGIGVPSQVEFESGRVVSSVNIPLEGMPLREVLGERFGVPVFIDNDANCAALAEAETSDPPVPNLVMLTLGTGVGGGIVIGGRIFRGATGLGAELGHATIEANGPPCPGSCPNRGCVEALCSGTALGRDALELAQDRPDSPLGAVLKERGTVTAEDAVAAAREGDEAAKAPDRPARRLPRGGAHRRRSTPSSPSAWPSAAGSRARLTCSWTRPWRRCAPVRCRRWRLACRCPWPPADRPPGSWARPSWRGTSSPALDLGPRASEILASLRSEGCR